MEEEKKNSNLEEIMKDSTLSNPELTFCEKTTYLDFLLSNAKTEEEKEEIKKIINDFLEISKEEEEESDAEEATEEEEVEIEKVETDSRDSSEEEETYEEDDEETDDDEPYYDEDFKDIEK